jgi:hypothetical protein
MPEDLIDTLIDAAHQLFNEYSIYEVMDLDREAARLKMVELYGPGNDDAVEKYLNVVDALRLA